jgi:hypothetical protein
VKKLFILLVLIVFIVDANAQRRRTSTRTSRTAKTTQSQESISNNLIYELRIGNVGLGNPVSISLKPGIGYKLNSIFSAGVNSKLYLDYFNNIASADNTYFSYGANLFARGKISKSIFLSGEYGYTKFDLGPTSAEFYYPTVGGGYVSNNGGKWSYGAEVFVPLNSSVRDVNGSAVEYWIGFYYNL